MKHKRGTNLAKTPAWQRRGVLVYTKKGSKKEGFNPLKNEHVTVTRNTVISERDLPLFSTPEGQKFLQVLIAGSP